jgi:ribose transport system substrate-binding protein
MTFESDSGTNGWRFIRTTTGVVLVLLALQSLTGCRLWRASSEITAIPLFATENLATCEHVGMEESLAETKLRLHWNGPSDGDVQRQIDLLNDAVKGESYGITFEPRSLYAANSVIEEAAARGIPVVIMLHPVPLESRPHISFVLEDIAEGARLAAERIALVTHGRGTVLLVGLDSLTPGGVDRFDAVESSLHELAPGIVVKARIAGPPTISFFVPLIRQTLQQQPGLIAIVALDSHAAYAAAEVVHELGAQSRVGIVAFDQNTEVLASLRRGGVDSVIVQNMREMGHVAIRNIVADRSGKVVPLLTYVKPVLVTRENIDNDNVQQLLLMNWDKP